MSEGPSGGFMIVWGWGSIVGLVTIASSPIPLQYLLTPLLFEWVILFLVALAMTESGNDNANDIQQREGETNGHYAIRAWASVHVFILKMPFIAVMAIPRTIRRGWSWVWETPKKDANGG